MSGDEIQPIIVKKVIKKGGGHHGGAWKVAYADFVTAMMAFFLLLWLLNVSTDEAKNLISSYFAPSHPTVSRRDSGAGGVLGGMSMSEEGSMATNKQPLAEKMATGKKGQGESEESATEKIKGYEPADIEKLKEELKAREAKRFDVAKKQLEQAIAEDEGLKALAKHLMIDITPEGLRIQIIDQEGNPMFAKGSAEIMPQAKSLLTNISLIIAALPNDLSIRGHTDASPFATETGYSNWELSADRANASRRIIMDSGVEEERIENVMGKAANTPFIEEDPLDPRNRRITIILLHETLAEALERGEFTAQEGAKDAQGDDFSPADVKPLPPKDEGFKKTPGEFYFP